MNAVAFVVGPSRSGTSVLAEALGRHPRIVTTEELHYYNLLLPAALASGDGPQKLLARLKAVQHHGQFFNIKNGTTAELPHVSEDELPPPGQPLLKSFFERLAKAVGAAAVVEQTPMNLYYLDEIRRDFPTAVFFLMHRDPRAILASQKMRWKVGSLGKRTHPERDLKRFRYAGHPFLQLLLLRKTLRVARMAASSADVHVVIYEELVRDPELTLTKSIKQLDLSYDPEMARVSDRGSSHVQEGERSGFDSSRLETWRASLSQTEIWLTERLYGKSLCLPATNVRPRAGEVVRLLLTFPRDLVLSLHYSAGSYGSLVDAIRRRFL